MTIDKPADLESRDTSGQVSYAIFDQALWTQFANADSVDAFVGGWLAMLMRNIEGATAAVVVLGDPDTGPFSPAAHWPGEKEVPQTLTAVAEQCLGRRQPVLAKREGGNDIALPLILDEHLYGVAAISVGANGTAPGEVIRHLRWGSGWIEVLLRRDQARSFEQLQSRTATALNMLATVLEQKRFVGACNALVTELARSLNCDPVSIGFAKRYGVKVVAVSHAAGFGKRMSLLRDIRGAMNEALDQDSIVLFPPDPDWSYRVTLAHEELVRSHKADTVLTVPIQYEGETIGAITLEKPGNEGFSDDTVELCDAIATVVGPVLEEKRRNDRALIIKIYEVFKNQLVRLLGPSFFGRKLATLIFLGLVWYGATATTTFTITAPAQLQGTIQRTVTAPFNGYLAAENTRAGSLVRVGDELARLDDRDLMLERLRLTTSRSQRQAEYDRALANRERAEANIIETQIRQIDSQIALIDEQIARTRIVAPFDGVVVSGDLSQSIGATVERGQELYKISPLDAYRVVLEVDETDVAMIVEGQFGQLRVTPLPDLPLSYQIERITPVSEQSDGRNFFRVDAVLEDTDSRLRPNMEGIARTEIEERLLVWTWTRPFVNWAKLTFWRWRP